MNPGACILDAFSHPKSQISNRITRLLTLANALLKLEFAIQLLCAFVVLVLLLTALVLQPIRLVRPVPRPRAANSRKHPTSAAKAVLRPDKPLAKCLIPLLFV